jgi:hypothetical protein
MAIHAAEAVAGLVYRPTRAGAFPRSYFKLHPWPVTTLVKRLEKKGTRASGREFGLLAQAKKHPDWPLFLWHVRGTDLFGDRWEVKLAMLVPPSTRLRVLKAKPGYK